VYVKKKKKGNKNILKTRNKIEGVIPKWINGWGRKSVKWMCRGKASKVVPFVYAYYLKKSLF